MEMKHTLLSVRQKLILCTTFFLVLSGCSSTRSPVGAVLNLDTDLRLLITAQREVNPDHNARPSPVVIRLYELKDPTTFDKADFVDIYERDEELLANTLVGRQVLKPVVPGEERQERLVLNPGTTHVGLFAEFSNYRGSSYKITFPVTQHNVFRDFVRVDLTGTEISRSK